MTIRSCAWITITLSNTQDKKCSDFRFATGLLRDKLHMKFFSDKCIKRCHKIPYKNIDENNPVGKPPPVMVRFSDLAQRAAVLNNRSLLKWTDISIQGDLSQFRLTSAIAKFPNKGCGAEIVLSALTQR
ncbi:hypothetical protein JTB14_029573 [Gonioctena quinquepunctata]|nr:hypothetical protein JTB14_029573 [Gonioctena quinquepunctata]